MFWIAVSLNIPNPNIVPPKNAVRFIMDVASRIIIIDVVSDVLPKITVLSCALSIIKIIRAVADIEVRIVKPVLITLPISSHLPSST